MKFKINSTCIYDDPDELISKYPCLNDFGFQIEEIHRPKIRRIRDEKGELIWFEDGFYTVKTSSVNIDSIEDLVRLAEVVGQNELIITKNEGIEIYDGYRE